METECFARLQRARDYREFLDVYLCEHGLSRSVFARKTGFCRGFPGDIISGRRRLTLAALDRFEKALKLPSDGKKLFRCLVMQEEPDLFPSAKSDTLASLIQDLRTKSWTTSHKTLPVSMAPSLKAVLKYPNTMSIFAAAGSPETGASLSQIQERTQIEKSELERCIEKMLKAGLLKSGPLDRYYPTDLHLFIQTSGLESVFTDLFSEACRAASRRAMNNVQSNEELFFTSSFCIDAAQLENLKTDLRKVVLSYVDGALKAEGDRVIKLLVSLHL